MKNRHLCRGRRSDPDLGYRADNTSEEETSPCGGGEMAGRQLTQDVVNETPAFRGSLNGIAVGKPPARFAGHTRTITSTSGQSVTKITFPGQVLGMMRAWPLPRVPTATTC